MEWLFYIGIGLAVGALVVVASGFAWMQLIKREQRRVFGAWDRAQGVADKPDEW